MAEPFQAELQKAIDDAGNVAALDERVAVALAGAYYKGGENSPGITFGPGWNELIRVSPTSGYDGIALHHPASRTLVILNRGTEGLASFKDVLQNIKSGVFRLAGPQMGDAMDLLVEGFQRSPPGEVDQILICGHSLGGALADAQGALAASLFASKGLTCPPVRVVGVASAGFADAARNWASTRNLREAPGADRFITHYRRAYDVVPNHLGRSTFGTDKTVASVFETRMETKTGPGPPIPQWRVVEDRLAQHKRTLYFQFLDEPSDRHIWYSRNAKTYVARPLARPGWETANSQPADW